VTDGAKAVYLFSAGAVISGDFDVTGCTSLKIDYVTNINTETSVLINDVSQWSRSTAGSGTATIDLTSFSGTVTVKLKHSAISGGNGTYFDNLHILAE
jgi:hypothetical protein